MFVRRGSSLSRVAVTWSRPEKDGHFSPTIYSAVSVMAEGGIGSRSADSARLFNRFSSPTTVLSFPFFFPLLSMLVSCGQSMCLPHLPTHVSLSSPLPWELASLKVFAASGVLASLEIKLAWGGTEMHNPSGAFVC